MNNVIIYFQTNKLYSLPGSFFDAFEYFIFTFFNGNKNINFYIFIPNDNFKEIIIKTIQNKYQLNDLIFFKQINFLYYKDYIKKFILKKFKKLFFFDLISLKKLQNISPVVEKIYYITEYTYPEDYYMLKKSNVIYCSEMPFCYSDKQIKLKFFFDIYKKYSSFENNLYVNYPKGDINEIKNILNKFENKQILQKEEQFYFDLHKKFDEYVYIKSPYWFDTHPRLFHECFFYGKNYHYINNLNIKDGSWYRFYDLQENGLKNRIMDKNDWLIKEMIN